MTKCDRCGKESYCIYVLDNFEKICDECYDIERKNINTSEKECLWEKVEISKER